LRLTSFTDYGLRVLMRMAGAPGRPFTTAELAEEFRVSRNHLAKVISALAAAGYLETRRGGGGGAILARQAADIRLRQSDRRRMASRPGQSASNSRVSAQSDVGPSPCAALTCAERIRFFWP